MTPADDIKRMIRNWNETTTRRMDQQVLADVEQALAKARERAAPARSTTWRREVWRRAGYLAAAFLVIAAWSVCLVSYRRIRDLENKLESARRAMAFTPAEDPATINVYLAEHQEVVAQQASLNTAAPPSLQMRLDQKDLLYYEIYGEPESMQPGLILRGRPSQQAVDSPESPAISNGHTLTLSEARQVADFDLVCPAWLRPCYRLEEIRRIEDRDALQLLYTNGISSISLFEQPLDGRRGLGPQDFREYVVYRNNGQAGGAILTWRDDARLYVLVGNAEISQLMDMAQSISAAK